MNEPVESFRMENYGNLQRQSHNPGGKGKLQYRSLYILFEVFTSCSKNRRDGATVSTRVLALADKVGRELYAGAAIVGNAEVSSSANKRRRKEIRTKARL